MGHGRRIGEHHRGFLPGISGQHRIQTAQRRNRLRESITYNPAKHHRKSIRLKGHDYTQAGAYFVTICTQNRECLFGDAASGEMIDNSAGKMILRAWQDLPVKYLPVVIDEFIVMPNHIHGIIVLPVGAGPCACPVPYTDRHPDGDQLNWGQLNKDGQPRGVAPTTTQLALTDIMHRFKSFTTSQYRNIAQTFFRIIGPHSPVNYGSVIIMNASSAMRMN